MRVEVSDNQAGETVDNVTTLGSKHDRTFVCESLKEPVPDWIVEI
jgi:hypothetical protein